ncbi:hypothetical protein ENBRE01_2910 [Enteropsectra breve]|nr:hypothetical protein ENBRE01_2910 [Enteropsectra breve]
MQKCIVHEIYSLFQGLNISCPKIQLPCYFKAIYKWVENCPEVSVLRNTGISKVSYSLIKSTINRFVDADYSSFDALKLGGTGLSVQVDETAICHGSLPHVLSQLEDDFPGITLLVGIIEQSTGRFKLKIVLNRSLETFKSLFERHINREITVITDGQASYPGAVRHIDGTGHTSL